MAGLLQVDTDLLRQAVQIASQANDAITNAMNIINRVTEHNDWICSERDTINEYARKNRQDIGILQNKASNFYTAIKTSSEKFDAKEKDLVNKSNKMDDIISKAIVKVTPISSTTSTTSGAATGKVEISDFSSISSSLAGNGGGIHG